MSVAHTYTGACHCGAVRFRITAAAIETGKRCNCSLCTRRGVVTSTPYFTPERIAVEGREALRLYVWGDRMVNHWFCGTCGIYVFHEAIERPGHLRVNLAAIDDVDPSTLPIDLVDGRSF